MQRVIKDSDVLKRPKSSWKQLIKCTLGLMSGLVLFAVSQSTIVQADGTTATTTSEPANLTEEPSNDVLYSGNWGTDWRIVKDDTGITLHISSGQLDDFHYDGDNKISPWADLKKEVESITTITFDGPVTAGESIAGLFREFTGVKQIKNFEYLDTTNTTDMGEMFRACESIESIDLSNIKTDNLQKMQGMFWGMTSLKTIDVSHFNVSKVSDFSQVFSNDTVIKDIDISNWDFSNAINFKRMFGSNVSMESVELPKIANPASPKSDFSSMFQNNFSLKSLDISNLDMSESTNVKDFLSSIPYANIQKLTLSSKNNLVQSGLFIDLNPINNGTEAVIGWKATAPEDKVGMTKTGTELKLMYNGKNDNGDKVTWEWDYAPYLSFNIKYVAADNPEHVLYTTDQITGHLPNTEYRVGSLSDWNQSLSGYDLEYEMGRYLLTRDLNGGSIIVSVPKLPEYLPFTLAVNEEDSNGKFVSSSSIKLPVKDPSIIGMDILKAFPDLSYDRELVPYDAETEKGSYIDVGKLDPKSPIDEKFKNVSEVMLWLFDILGNGVSSDPNFQGLTYTVHAVYTPEPDTDTGNGSNSGGSSGGGSSNVDRDVTEIKETIGTHGNNSDVQLYDDKGQPIDDVKLAPSSDWYTDNLMTLKGVKYYHVATGMWAKADDIYVYYSNNSNVLVNEDKIATLITSQGKKVTDRALQKSSGWYSDRYIYINDVKHYRVATNEFVSSDEVQEY